MKTQTTVRVFSPFQNRVVVATPEQARILRQVRRAMNFYVAAGAERGTLHQQEWKRKTKKSILGELEMLDTTVAGVASWCGGAHSHPAPDDAIRKMMAYDIAELSTQLSDYPQLQSWLEAQRTLRELVKSFLQQKRSAA